MGVVVTGSEKGLSEELGNNKEERVEAEVGGGCELEGLLREGGATGGRCWIEVEVLEGKRGLFSTPGDVICIGLVLLPTGATTSNSPEVLLV